MRRGSSGVRAWNGAGSGPKNAETYLGRLSQDLPIGPKPVPFGITLKTSKYEPPKGTTLGPMGMDRPILSTSLSICLSAYLSRSMSCCSFKERGIQTLRTGTVLAIRPSDGDGACDSCLLGREAQTVPDHAPCTPPQKGPPKDYDHHKRRKTIRTTSTTTTTTTTVTTTTTRPRRP